MGEFQSHKLETRSPYYITTVLHAKKLSSRNEESELPRKNATNTGRILISPKIVFLFTQPHRTKNRIRFCIRILNAHIYPTADFCTISRRRSLINFLCRALILELAVASPF